MVPHSKLFRSKRAKLALRFFTYGVMTLATVVFSTVAIFYALGYRFNQTTLTFEQGGLVQFRSNPTGATVLVDGQVQSTRTPGRINLPAGSRDIEMRLDDYRNWYRTVTLMPGQLLWLNYTRFIPNNVTTTPLRAYDTLHAVMPSPDKRWMLLQEKQQEPDFVLADFNNEENPVFTKLRLPESELTKNNGAYGTFTVTEWGLNSRHFLVRHQNADVTEWLRVDRTSPEDAINVSQLFGLEIADMQLSGSSPNVVFARTGDVLRQLDINANNASAALVNGVQRFSVYGDNTVSFIGVRQMSPEDQSSMRRVVGLYRNNQEIVVQTYPADISPSIAYSKYDGHDYLAVHRGDGVVHVLRNPDNTTNDSAQFATFNVGRPLQWLQFSDNGRMIMAGAGSLLVTHDLEVGQTYRSQLAFAQSESDKSVPVRWLDNYYVWSDIGGQLHLAEFDGQNQQHITSVAPGYRVMLSQSGEFIFSIVKQKQNGYQLQVSSLLVE